MFHSEVGTNNKQISRRDGGGDKSVVKNRNFEGEGAEERRGGRGSGFKEAPSR